MNLIQNNVSIHERAIRQSVVVTQDKDDPPVVLSANGSLRGSVSSDNTMAAISMVIPRGKAVALPSIKITEEEEKNIERSFYGGKGDKPHLGGFTEFDVSGKYLLMSALILTYLTSDCAPLSLFSSQWAYRHHCGNTWYVHVAPVLDESRSLIAKEFLTNGCSVPFF